MGKLIPVIKKKKKKKKKAGVGQPKYCNNVYIHVVLTNLCSIIFYLKFKKLKIG